MRNQLAYDLPVRIFHWLFAGLFLTSFLIANVVDDDSPIFSYHMIFGLILSFVVIFRLVWGFLGTKYAKFSSFPLNPAELIKYFTDILSGNLKRHFGQNPASAWAALTMMFLALGLGLTGYLMSTGQKKAFEDIHEVLANTFIVVVGLHIAGIILHTLRHKEIIGLSMIDGKKEMVPGSEPIENSRPLVALLFIILTTAFAFNLFKNYNTQTRALNFFGTTLQLGENESEENESGGQGEGKNETGKDSDGDQDDD